MPPAKLQSAAELAKRAGLQPPPAEPMAMVPATPVAQAKAKEAAAVAVPYPADDQSILCFGDLMCFATLFFNMGYRTRIK